MRFLFALMVGLLCSGCLGPIGYQADVVKPSLVRGGAGLVRLNPDQFPQFIDDGDPVDLLVAADESARYFRSLPSDRDIVVGPDVYSAQHMAESLEAFRKLMGSDQNDIQSILERDYVVYSSVGSEGNSSVVYSSYYEHDLRASLKKTARYRFPLYGRPADLEERTVNGERRVFRGGGKPYYTREEIDSGQSLRGQGLEIAWAEDPVSIFFLQVQGSGWLLLPDGERVRVRYAANNGHPYVSVGRTMISKGIIPQKKFSRKAMVDYLASHTKERQRILNYNPRYVFFKIDRGPTSPWAYGSLNVPLTPGRSIATDPALFPPGGLAWIETKGKYNVRRFVLNQDQGGAIKGPARVDYFAGSGEAAEKYAVGFWEKGRLYFVVKKRGGM